MAIQLKLSGKSGVVKRNAASNIYSTFNSAAIWYDSNSSAMSVGTSFSTTNKDWVVWEGNGYMEVEIGPDKDGQGLYIVGGSTLKWTVTTVSGTVKKLSRKFVTMATEKADAFSSSDAVSVSVGDVLDNGDILVCGGTSSFRVKIEGVDPPTFLSLNLVQNALLD